MDRLLTPAEVAKIFRVDAKTVVRWGKPTKTRPARLKSVKTPGGHARFFESEVMAVFSQSDPGAIDGGPEV